MKKFFYVITVIGLFVSVCWFMRKNTAVMSFLASITGQEPKKVIVIDPGHGGFDPGKVGVNGVNEKEVNLKIAMKLKKLFEQDDFEVIMTRETDDGLYSEGDSNKKRTDMRKRVEMINASSAAAAVSIHQNSFEQESSRGAQVFYHVKSEEGKKLAEIIQEQIKETIGDGNHRVAKSNDNYYMLKKTNCPLVIVECGFMSNHEEAALLCDDAYQEKMAWAIYMGTMKYLNQEAD